MPNSYIVVTSADAEWQVVSDYFPGEKKSESPFGEWFSYSYPKILGPNDKVIFFHGGWGKVAAAASTQYSIMQWKPKLLINLGTCGGFVGSINKGEILLVDKTIIYDIYEQMGDPEEHIQHYTSRIDTSWLDDTFPIKVRQSLLVTGDRDIFPSDITQLKEKYGAIAGDWESGAIAWVAARNKIKCLILRGVTDLIGDAGGEAYNGNVNIFFENTKQVMQILLDSLPLWLYKYQQYKKPRIRTRGDLK